MAYLGPEVRGLMLEGVGGALGGLFEIRNNVRIAAAVTL
jgi:hypothetical protein